MDLQNALVSISFVQPHAMIDQSWVAIDQLLTFLINNLNPDQEVAQADESPNLMVDDFVLDSAVKITGFRLIVQQLAALYIKRFHNTRRNLKGLFCEVISHK